MSSSAPESDSAILLEDIFSNPSVPRLLVSGSQC